jgi:hypothetical protein
MDMFSSNQNRAFKEAWEAYERAGIQNADEKPSVIDQIHSSRNAPAAPVTKKDKSKSTKDQEL